MIFGFPILKNIFGPIFRVIDKTFLKSKIATYRGYSTILDALRKYRGTFVIPNFDNSCIQTMGKCK